MSIEANYMKKITEIKAVKETLSAFETKFIFGDADGQPISERSMLSDKQKAMIDRIYKERVQGLDRQASATIEFGNERVMAVQVDGNKSYRVTVDKTQIGPIVNFGEATNVVSWLSTVLNSNELIVTTPGASPSDTGFPGE